MSGVTVQQMADRVAGLMGERLRIGGKDLREKLKRGGRVLPRKVRREAEYLAEAAEQAQVPKLLLQLDHERVASAYDACVKYLRPLGAGARRWMVALRIAASLVLAALVTLGLVFAVLVWRGYL